MFKAIEHIRNSFSLLPKSLYKRFILIIIVPTLFSQIVVTYIFYNRHWENVQHQMVVTVAEEISALIKILRYSNNSEFIDRLKNTYPINFNIINEQKFPDPDLLNNEDSRSIRILENELKLLIKEDFAFRFQDNKTVIGYIRFDNKLIKLLFHKKRIENSSSVIFIIWMFGASLIFFILAILISRNQITPIIKLAKAMERFGRGKPVTKFSLKGAQEVRQAGAAFLEMKDRIEKFVSQRTLMLAGVSHDLRTPLTRIKLQLSMMKDAEVEDIKKDIQEMEGMISSYLSFAKGEEGEQIIICDAVTLLREICEVTNYRNLKFDFELQNCEIHVRKDAFKRAIDNIIKNSSVVASQVFMKGYIQDHLYCLEIHDNGPGISQDSYDDVMKPFFRIDKARKSHNSEVGLGLAITKDLIARDGGELYLSSSNLLGGLCVKIIIAL